MKVVYSNTGGIGLLRNYEKGKRFEISCMMYERLQNKYGMFMDLCLMERASKKWFADCTLHKETLKNDEGVKKNPFDAQIKCYIMLGEEIHAKNEVDFFEKRALKLFNPYDETIPF